MMLLPDTRSHEPPSPEASLVTAIIMRAYADLLASKNSADTASGSSVSLTEREQALKFLTETSGRYATLRNEYCDFVGFDGDVLAERIRAMLDGERDFPVPHESISPAILERHDKAVSYVRAMWIEQKKPKPEPERRPRPATKAKLAPLPKAKPKHTPWKEPPKPRKRKAPPKPDPTPVIMAALKDGQKTVRELNFVMHGDVPNDRIRAILKAAVANGDVEYETPHWRFKTS